MKNEKPSMCDELKENIESQYNDEFVITFKFAVTGYIPDDKYFKVRVGNLCREFYSKLNSLIHNHTGESIFPISCEVELFGVEGE